MAMLEIRDLEVYYGMIQAIKGISFDVKEGEVIALIGSNGAGKTTTLHTITGLLSAKAGVIRFEGEDITKVPGYKIVSKGMAHVPEGRRVFAQLSVLQNLRMGAYTRKDKNEIEEKYSLTRFNENGKSIDSLLRNRALCIYFMDDIQKSFFIQPIENKCCNSNTDNVYTKYNAFLCYATLKNS